MAKKRDPEHRLQLRNLQISDYSHIKEIMDLVYSNAGGSYTKKEFAIQLAKFPEGQICIEDNGRVVAAAFSIIVKYSKFGDKHSYAEITANGSFDSHDPDGDTLYGTDIFVHPEHQGLRLGRRLYDARKELCENLNLRSIIAGGRIPGYNEYSDQYSPKEYIDMVKSKEVYDKILTFQIANDFHVRKIITNYLPEDIESQSYATLIEWINIFYEEENTPLIGGKKSIARVGVVQWQMRRTNSLEDLCSRWSFLWTRWRATSLILYYFQSFLMHH